MSDILPCWLSTPILLSEYFILLCLQAPLHLILHSLLPVQAPHGPCHAQTPAVALGAHSYGGRAAPTQGVEEGPLGDDTQHRGLVMQRLQQGEDELVAVPALYSQRALPHGVQHACRLQVLGQKPEWRINTTTSSLVKLFLCNLTNVPYFL